MCVGNLTIIGSDDGLSPGRRAPGHCLTQCLDSANWTLGADFSETLIELTFSLKQRDLKVSSATQRPFCLSLGALNTVGQRPFNYSMSGMKVCLYSNRRIID